MSNDFHLRILEDIARDQSGDIIFPVSFKLSSSLRDLTRRPDATLQQIARLVSIEALVLSRLLRLSNSVSRNPVGKTITSIENAINRLGFEQTRSVALATAIEQLMCSVSLKPFSKISAILWRHSVRAAASAKVIAKRMTRIRPDEAMTAGLVHDLGAFYVLYRASRYDEFRRAPETVKPLIKEWHGGMARGSGGITALFAGFAGSDH